MGTIIGATGIRVVSTARARVMTTATTVAHV